MGAPTFLAMKPWALHMRARGLSERTIAEQTATVARIATDLGVFPIDLTTDQLAVWFAGKDLSVGSRATYRVALKAWFDYLILADLRLDDPTRKLGKVRTIRNQPRPMQTAHLTALLQSGIRRRTRSMILLSAYQGFRVSEIARVRGEHVDRVTKHLYVKGKGGREDWLPLHPVIEMEARRRPPRGLWFPSYTIPGPVLGKSVSRVISDAMSRAGIPGTPHALRHWYGTELRRAGVDLRTVQELMRHANLATTAIYTQVDDREMSDALRLLPEVA